MKQQLLFIQGAGEGAYSEDQKLVDSLCDSLGSSFEVRYPAMENEIDAPYNDWVDLIKKELITMNDEVILVGHSVGASVLIKFLSETEIRKNVAGVFLIATPFWGGNGGWTYEGYEQLELPNVEGSKFNNDVPLFFYHSEDDEVVPYAHLALYAKRFVKATVRELSGRDHQLNNNLSEVAEDIKNLKVV